MVSKKNRKNKKRKSIGGSGSNLLKTAIKNKLATASKGEVDKAINNPTQVANQVGKMTNKAGEMSQGVNPNQVANQVGKMTNKAGEMSQGVTTQLPNQVSKMSNKAGEMSQSVTTQLPQGVNNFRSSVSGLGNSVPNGMNSMGCVIL